MTVAPLQEPRPIEMPAPVRTPGREAMGSPWRPGRRALLLAVVILLALGLGVAGWQMFLRPVAVVVAGAGADIPLQVFGLGTVGADVQSGVGFKVSGVLVRIAANEGDHVKAGQILAQLDARDIAAQVAQARAGVGQARSAIDKAKADIAAAQASLANAAAMAARRATLVKHGFASVEDTETERAAEQVATANLAVARAERNTAQAGLAAALAQQQYQEATLANYALRAPYDAWVVARNLNLGAMPVPGQAVFTLVDPRTIWVLAYVDERLAGRLAVGDRAEIVLRSQPGKRFAGHIARIEIQSDAVNEERLVDVAFDHLPPDIHLAEQAEAIITTGRLARAVPVPQGAMSDLAGDPGQGGRGRVWTLEHGRLERREVTFGPQLLDGSLPVVSGLPEGARVVVSPLAGLRAGRAARIASAQP